MTLEAKTSIRGGKGELDILEKNVLHMQYLFYSDPTVSKLGKIILKFCTSANDCI